MGIWGKKKRKKGVWERKREKGANLGLRRAGTSWGGGVCTVSSGGRTGGLYWEEGGCCPSADDLTGQGGE